MTTQRFEEIQEEIEEKKAVRSKAEGTMETIAADWKEKHGFSTVEEAEAERDRLNEEVVGLEEKESTLAQEIEDLMEEMDG